MTTVAFSVVGLLLPVFMVWVAHTAYGTSAVHRERTPNPASGPFMLKVGLVVVMMFQGISLLGALAGTDEPWGIPLALLLGACVALLALFVREARSRS